MSKINYEKILEKLVANRPHDLASIEQVVLDAKKNDKHVSIDFKTIIDSREWTSDEMFKLLRIFNYNPYLKNINDYNWISSSHEEISAFRYILKHKHEQAFVACIKVMVTFDEPCNNYNLSVLEDAYRRIVSIIFDQKNQIDKVKYLTLMLENTPEELLKRVIQTKFVGYLITSIENESIFEEIIKTKDIDLIKKYIKYIDDINLYLGKAVATGDQKIVQLFLDKGADVNYQCDERILGYITPIKMAIRCNDYEMYKFLKDKGASIDTEIKDRYFKNRLLNWNIDIKDFNYSTKEHLRNEESLIALLRFKRCSSPLEYAITLNDYNMNVWNARTEIEFFDSLLLSNGSYSSEKIANRAKIIDDIYNSLSDKSKVDYTKLIISTFATRNTELFEKCANYVINNRIKIACKDIIDSFFVFEMFDSSEIFDSFLNLVEKFDKKEKSLSYLLKEFYDRLRCQELYLDFDQIPFLKLLLDRMPVEERIKAPIIVYSKDLNIVKSLEECGCSVNDVDEKGENVLFNLLCHRRSGEELSEEEWELFEYLLTKVNLSHKDNEGKTVLHYLMNLFDTNNEYEDANPKNYGPKNNIETATAKIIEKMDKESVCNKEISDILDNRVEHYPRNCGGHIYLAYIFQHHKDLFDALLKKGFKFSNTFYSNLFTSLFPKEDIYNETLKNRINVPETVKYVFENIDRNTEIQCLDIREPFNDIITYLGTENATFEGFAQKFIDFNNKIRELMEFYNNNILKRYNPEKYVIYAEEVYHTTYRDFNDMLLKIITTVLVKFPDEDINTILSLTPSFDINYQTDSLETSYKYSQYYDSIYSQSCHSDENGEEVYEENLKKNRFEVDDCVFNNNYNFSLTGGLVQFVIFINRIDYLKELVKRGGKLEVIGEDGLTWKYVNSQEMLAYMESILGDSNCSDLDNDERAYYLSLISENNKKTD